MQTRQSGRGVDQVTLTIATEVREPNREFARLASEEQIERTVKALEANGMAAIVMDDGDEARKKVHELLPPQAEVLTSTSRTLDAIGLTEEIDQSQDYRPVRPRLMQLNYQTQADEMRKIGASPDYVVGSVHAVTEQGQVLVASASGSQLGLYASGSDTVIWVVGAQKIVPDLEEGFRRINQYSYPLEDARAQAAYGMGSAINKILIVNGEFRPGRITIVLVKESLGY
jgi:L-lactate utilization protein LutC